MSNLTVVCPICNGIAGINVASFDEVEDWHDCDFCEATGEVQTRTFNSCHSSVDPLAQGYWHLTPVGLESGDIILFPIWTRNPKLCRNVPMWGFSCCSGCTNHKANKTCYKN